jgi:FkbM family methyltransferase
MGSRIGEVGRAISRRYPIMPFRGRFSVLHGPVDRIPDGALVTTHEGVAVKVHPDGMYSDVYFWGDYQPFNTKIYKRLVTPGDVVFDVGANFGWFSTLFAKWTRPTGEVHAFEPVPFIQDLATQTIADNDVSDRVTLNRFGLGRSAGTIVIRTFEGLPHGHATAAGDLGRDDAIEHICEIRTLDDYFRSTAIDHIDFMKVDVEGFESDVFLGGEEVLRSDSAPIIAFELNDSCLRARSIDPNDVGRILVDFGYTKFFTWSTRRGVRWVDEMDFAHGDYVAGKPQHAERLSRAASAGRVLR